MTNEDWERVKELFESAAPLTAEKREELLRDATPDVRETVKELLDSHDQATAFLTTPLVHAAHIFGLDDDRPVFEAGQVLCSRFEILRYIGRGGMGEVYKALDRDLKETVALKTIRRRYCRDQATLERFRREVQRSRRVTHENVCRIYDLFAADVPDTPGIPFLTMEYLNGRTLRQVLKTGGPLSHQRAMPVVQQICAGLSSAHRAGLIHRDLKSSNVILVEGAEPPRTMITDFGLARSTAPIEDTANTVGGTLSGTPAYLAPELLIGQPPSIACDIYSLGVVLYETVTGRFPFEAEDELIALTMRLKVRPRSPRELVPSLPPEWERAILLALSVDPAARPRDAIELAVMLSGSFREYWPLWLRSMTASTLARRTAIGGVILLTVGWGGSVLYESFSRSPLEPIVFLTDFETGGGVPIELGRAARSLLRISLGQSPRIRFSAYDDAVGELSLTGESETPLRADRGLEIARQHRIPTVIAGEIRSLGTGYDVEIRAFRVLSSKVVLRLTDKTSSPGELTTVLDRLSSRLRLELGEPDNVLKGSRQPLEVPDSGSAPAVALFARGLEHYKRGDPMSGIAFVRRAVAVDPGFVMGHVYEAFMLSALRHEEQALAPMQRARELASRPASRVTERQRQQLEALYAVLHGDFEGALPIYRNLADQYPNDSDLQRHLAHHLAVIGQPQAALQYARRAVDLSPYVAASHSVLASVLIECNRPEEALGVFESARVIIGKNPLLQSGEGVAWLVADNPSKAIAVLDPLLNARDIASLARGYRARCMILNGRIEATVDELEANLALDQMNDDKPAQDRSRYWLGQLHLLCGRNSLARVQARALAGRSAIPPYLFALRAAAELAFGAKDADTLATIVAKLTAIDHTWPCTRSRAFLSHSKGLAAWLNGDGEGARKMLVEAKTLWPDLVHLYTLGYFYVNHGNYREAVEPLDRVVASRGTALRWDFVVLWLLAHAWSGRSWEGAGNTDVARERFVVLVRYLGNQREEIPLVADAERRLSLVTTRRN